MTYLFYDGGCGLCRGSVRFVARREQSGPMRFAPLNGTTFESLISAEARAGLPDSLVVLTPEGNLRTESGAVIHLLGRMGPAWRLAGAALAWIPAPLRDGAYRLMARLRPRKQGCAWAVPLQDDRFDP